MGIDPTESVVDEDGEVRHTSLTQTYVLNHDHLTVLLLTVLLRSQCRSGRLTGSSSSIRPSTPPPSAPTPWSPRALYRTCSPTASPIGSSARRSARIRRVRRVPMRGAERPSGSLAAPGRARRSLGTRRCSVYGILYGLPSALWRLARLLSRGFGIDARESLTCNINYAPCWYLV